MLPLSRTVVCATVDAAPVGTTGLAGAAASVGTKRATRATPSAAVPPSPFDPRTRNAASAPVIASFSPSRPSEHRSTSRDAVVEIEGRTSPAGPALAHDLY